ncbi:MAG: hypothetical protein IJS08_12915 [Victivallales bacterium]|nr:hypothetical protein [Victivallales bacterium]
MSEIGKSLIDEYGNIHHLSSELARGGQGVVFRTKDVDLAIKQPLGPDGQPDGNRNVSEIFRRVRTLPLPKGIQISLPLAILRDEPGYVMKLLGEMKPFSDFSLDGEKRAEMAKTELPVWLSGIQDVKLAMELAYYAQTGSTRRRLYSLYKCAAILARLHNAGIVYGDISANNVFIGKDIPCDCWLIDADNLRLELAAGGHSVYTPHLGAPEIVQGKDCSRPRTDCWAFAVMAFQLLALCHPFIGKKVLEPDEDNSWDADTSDNGPVVDMDEQAYAGLLPYIDDEEDDSNALPGGGLPRSLILTPQLQRLFQETFGAGRLQPHRRPSMAFWALELARAFDNSLICPSCQMSYYYTSDTDKCPYCQTPTSEFALVRTDRWQKVLCGDAKHVFECAIPHRLFHPFSLANGDMDEYEAAVDIANRQVTSVRGTKTLPPDLAFEIISCGDVHKENAK